MKVFLIDYNGTSFELPILLSWTVTHGLGSPADSIELCCVFDEGMKTMLSGAVRIKGVHEGNTVFSGVVDEYEIRVDSGGAVVDISGRGLAALLLDNEAEAAEYSVAGLADILSRHATPCGISDIRADSIPPVTGFTVESGSSQWKALKEFTHYSAGITPRFSGDGTLVISSAEGKRFAINDGTAVSDLLLRERRYGVISEVLVKNQVMGTSETVLNQAFIDRGGSCRRVVNVPRTTGYAAMRYTGSYQIEASEEDSVVCYITLPALFAAAPADIVSLELKSIGIFGEFKVSETEVWADGGSAGTRIKLVPAASVK